MLNDNPDTSAKRYHLAYGYALAVLHLSDIQGVRHGVDNEADVHAFAAAYRSHYAAHPGTTPDVSSAFGEWRATGHIVDPNY